MTNDAPEQGGQKTDDRWAFLYFRGPVSRLWFFLGLVAELLLLFVAMASVAGLNNPTGGGSAGLALIGALLALWLHLTLVVGRMRDAGAPVFLGIVLTLAAFAWPLLMLEFIEFLWPLILAVFLLLYLAPGFFKPKLAAELPPPPIAG